jgi:DNA-binding CsgD family transcriptional regulator
MPGDAEPAVSLELTPPEEQLLALIREGRVDAEIAVRLGITNRDVKERIERLVAKLGVRDRAELRDATPDEDQPAPALPPGPDRTAAPVPRMWLAGAGLLGLAVGVALTWFAMRETGETVTLADFFANNSPVAIESAGDRSAAVGSPTATATTRSTTIAGRTMLDLGQMFARPGNPGVVTNSDAREDLLVVELVGSAVIRLASPSVEWRRTGGGLLSLNLTAKVAGLDVALFFQVADGTEFLLGAQDSVGIYAKGSARPQLVVWAEGGPPGGTGPLHLDVTDLGNLLLSFAPMPRDLVVLYDTGEALDLSGALRLGTVPVRASSLPDRNQCDRETGTCRVSVISLAGPLVAPVDGVLTCRADGAAELVAAEFVLTFEATGTGRRACSPVGRRNVRAGDFADLPVGLISAYALDGTPLSAVAAKDGTLYVGVIRPKYGCPCRHGS